MTTTAPPPPPKPSRPLPGSKIPVGPAAPDALDVALDMGPTKLKGIGDKIVFYAVEGFGKTTIGAHAPDPFIIKGPRENGYDVLLKYERVPNVPSRDVTTWPELRAVTQKLAKGDTGRKWIVVDSASVMEAMCRQYVCDTVFSGDWGEHGFASYGKGEDRVAVEWMNWLSDLERAIDRGMSVMLLCHTTVKSVKNPEGADYDAFQPDLRDKTKAPTNRWGNAILFGRFVTAVDVEKRQANKNIAEQKGKGVGGTVRIIRCENRDAATAKNQMGFPEVIDIPNDQSQAFDAIAQYLK